MSLSLLEILFFFAVVVLIHDEVFINNEMKILLKAVENNENE